MLNFRQRYCKFFVHAIRFRLDCQPKFVATHYSARAYMCTLRLFHKNKCRSVYSLIINLLELFSSDIKCRLFVGKIMGNFSSLCIALYKEFRCVFRCFAVRFTMKCIAFYEAIGGKTSQKRLRFYMKTVAFLYRNACKT